MGSLARFLLNEWGRVPPGSRRGGAANLPLHIIWGLLWCAASPCCDKRMRRARHIFVLAACVRKKVCALSTAGVKVLVGVESTSARVHLCAET